MYRIAISLLFTLCTGFLGVATAQDADIDGLHKTIAELVPGVTPDSIKSTPVPGLYEVIFGATLVYVSSDGRYMLQGNMVDLHTRENLTENALGEIRLKALDSMDEDQLVIFEPENFSHTVTVFTDIDCGYCRKLHSEMAELNELGIRVRYAFYPRAGPNTPSYDKAVSVWCADDRNTAMTRAKAGRSIDPRTCENPVNDHMKVADEMGLSGTPFMVMENGQKMPGYIPAVELFNMLEDEKKQL